MFSLVSCGIIGQGGHIGRLEGIGCLKWTQRTDGHVLLSFKNRTY
jgi:hypothetical protein